MTSNAILLAWNIRQFTNRLHSNVLTHRRHYNFIPPSSGQQLGRHMTLPYSARCGNISKYPLKLRDMLGHNSAACWPSPGSIRVATEHDNPVFISHNLHTGLEEQRDHVWHNKC